MEKIKKHKLLIIVLALITLIVVSIALTYAYFTAEVEGNDTASTVKITAGNLIIDFETSAYINNTKANLIKDEDRASMADKTVFTISHATNSNGPAEYTLSLQNVEISSNLKSKDFKWELLINNTVVASGNFANLSTGNTYKLISTARRLEKNDVDKGELRVWLSETSSDQSSLYGGKFKAKVAIEAKTVQG